jgi:Na+/H+ antiporter NhaA
MAIFFLLIGLEVKREFLEGQLSTPSQIALPGIAAIGGMLVPACFYAFINFGDETAMRFGHSNSNRLKIFAQELISLLARYLNPVIADYFNTKSHC